MPSLYTCYWQIRFIIGAVGKFIIIKEQFHLLNKSKIFFFRKTDVDSNTNDCAKRFALWGKMWKNVIS